jgi:hypothetical protein
LLAAREYATTISRRPGNILAAKACLRAVALAGYGHVFDGHDTLPNPYWRAYKWVNNQFPKIRLVRTVDRLVERARSRLKEAGESYLMSLKREAHEGEVQAQGLLKAVVAFEEDASKALKIKWENYEQLLFTQDKKPVQLVCDDLSASPRMRCYARILEIIAEDQLRYERMRPLLDCSHRLS